jgi:hypothetical protein
VRFARISGILGMEDVMKLGKGIFSLVLAMAAILAWAGCGGGGCPTATLSSTGGSGSGGGVSSAGTVCGPGTTPPPANGNIAAFLYYKGTNTILGCRPLYQWDIHCPYHHSADSSEQRGQ